MATYQIHVHMISSRFIVMPALPFFLRHNHGTRLWRGGLNFFREGHGVNDALFPVRGCQRRGVHHTVSASNFEQSVLQSEQAICLVFYVENSNCRAYMRHAEKLADNLNKSTSLNKDGKTDEQSYIWLKFCLCNADENRNLASVFSVERAKLPVTYFVMQGTIIDKAVGHVKEPRLESILLKFLEHYQKEMNVNLLVARGKESASNGQGSPLPAAPAKDLLGGATTEYIVQSLMSSLTGSEMIRLPEESEKMDGIRRTIQEAKKKAHNEILELRREIGMDIRNLSQQDLAVKYYRSPQFSAFGAISALEALFLARSYAAIGDIARKNVAWARKALQSDFEEIFTLKNMRLLVALIDANLVLGDLRFGTAASQRFLDSTEPNTKNDDAELREALTSYIQFGLRMTEQINECIDSRSHDLSFPASFSDYLFGIIKQCKSKTSGKLSTRRNVDDSAAERLLLLLRGDEISSKEVISVVEEEQFNMCKTIITCLIQLYPSDTKSLDSRARLASLVY